MEETINDIKALKKVLLQKLEKHYQTLIDNGDADDIIPLFKVMREKTNI
jgi:hypothetical protein